MGSPWACPKAVSKTLFAWGGSGGVQGAQLDHANAKPADGTREQPEQHQHGDALKKRLFTGIRHSSSSTGLFSIF
jgi:hypothetical protein